MTYPPAADELESNPQNWF